MVRVGISWWASCGRTAITFWLHLTSRECVTQLKDLRHRNGSSHQTSSGGAWPTTTSSRSSTTGSECETSEQWPASTVHIEQQFRSTWQQQDSTLMKATAHLGAVRPSNLHRSRWGGSFHIGRAQTLSHQTARWEVTGKDSGRCKRLASD